MSIQEMEDLKQQYLDKMKHLINSDYRNEIKIDEFKGNFNITPSLSTEEPDNSLSMGDEHLDTILATKSNEFIKSSVENLILIPSESEGIPDNMYSFSIDNIDYVEASSLNSKLVSSEVMEIVIPEVGGIDDDILLTIKDDILCEKLLNINLLIANIEALNNPTPSSDFVTNSSSTSLNSLLEETNTFDNSLPKFETFCFYMEEISSGSTTTRSDISLLEYEAFYDDHVKEISSGSTTTHSDSSLYDSFIFDLSINPFPPANRSDFYEFADELIHIISSPEYDCFFFKIEPNSGNFTMDVVEDISPTRKPRVHNALPTHPTLQLNLEFKLSSESHFTYVIWIFLPFLLYSVAPQYLLSLGNEDTIFDPGIYSYHISPMNSRSSQAQDSVNKTKRFVGGTPCLSYSRKYEDSRQRILYSNLHFLNINLRITTSALVLTVGHNAKKRKTFHSNWNGKATKGKSDRGSKRKDEYEIAPTSDPKEVGLKESRRLKHGELNLVIGNKKITPVIRIGKYELMLKSRVRIDLNNCCYSSKMIRNIISFHALYKVGYKFSFDNKNGDILVYSNGCFMFKASPCKGIYETVKCISHNGNVILNVGSSNELDKSKLWHSRLGHINKKRIAQLQKDRVLESFDFKLIDVCEFCLLGKMTKSPFIGSCEDVKDY
nr:hypothetical protein [Tanacetum cinerariifolium]